VAGIVGERRFDLTAIVFVGPEFHFHSLVLEVVHPYPGIVAGNEEFDFSALTARRPVYRLNAGDFTAFGVLTSRRLDMYL
jgi:hypothetical protein